MLTTNPSISGYSTSVIVSVAINFEILTQQNPNLQMSFTVFLATYIGGISFFLGACFRGYFVYHVADSCRSAKRF